MRNCKEFQERVVLPEECTLSRSAYLQSLEAGAQVQLLRRAAVHGLCDRPGNHTLWEQRALFIEFVKCNRTPTGRTQLADGTIHGAEYYLNSQFTCIKPYTARGRTQNLAGWAQEAAKVEEEASSVGGDTMQTKVMNPSCLSDVFCCSLAVRAPQLKVPCGGAVLAWFKELFDVPTAPHGHTTLFPKKTDACSTCSEEDQEIRKLTGSIARHLQHVEDAGSVVRQQALAELRTMLAEVTER